MTLLAIFRELQNEATLLDFAN